MRHTQTEGLSIAAENFLEENAQKTPRKICEHCGHAEGGEIIREVYDISGSLGMFNDGPLLYSYTLKDGNKVKEICQASPWGSGPVIFLCLENEKGEKIGKW